MPKKKRAVVKRRKTQQGDGIFRDIAKAIGPLVKQIAPVLAKEILLPLIKKKVGAGKRGAGLKTPGNGLKTPGNGLKTPGNGRKRKAARK